MTPPSLADLIGSVVVLRDRDGRGARYIVDHVRGELAICSDPFRGRHASAAHWRPGQQIELGAPAERGWLVGIGRVERVTGAGSVTLTVGPLEVVQRRGAYREEIVVPLLVRAHPADRVRRGRTDNLSASGFAARLEGHPIADGTEVLVTFSMPERDELTLVCRKVSGDLAQRFEFVDIDGAVEERLARLVRATELARRRAEHHAE